jgi:hypothetical protein
MPSLRSLLTTTLLLGLAACDAAPETTETDADTDGGADTDWVDTGSTESEGCDAQITMFDPVDGANGVERTPTIHVWYTAPVPENRWSLAIDDVEGTATRAADGLSAQFLPATELDASATYTVRATACDDAATSTFVTVSDPLEPADLVGRTYALAFADVEWVKPSSTVASLIKGQIELEYLLTEVATATEDELSVSGAVGSEGVAGPEQAACYPTIAYGGVDFSENPHFDAGPSTLTIPTGTFTITMEQMRLSANFTATGDALENVELAAQVDVRPIDASIGETSDLCGLVELFGDACEPCSDGAEKCLPIEIHAESAAWVEDLDIDETYDPSTDLNCF